MAKVEVGEAMKMCGICNREIFYFQSYEMNGVRTAHMACSMGREPATHPSAHFSHAFPSQFGEDGRKVRRTVRSDEGMVFDE